MEHFTRFRVSIEKNGSRKNHGSLPGRPLSLGVLCCFPVRRPATDPLTVDDAVRIAVDQNLGLQVETYNPAIAATDIRRARSIYDPTALRPPRPPRGEPAGGPIDRGCRTDPFLRRVVSLDQLLPTGATTSASFTNFWSSDNLGLSTSRFAQPRAHPLPLPAASPGFRETGHGARHHDGGRRDGALPCRLGTSRRSTRPPRRGNRFSHVVKARESLATRNASLAVARRVHEQNEARVEGRGARRLRAAGFRAGSPPERRRTSWTRSGGEGTPPTSSGSRCTFPRERSSRPRRLLDRCRRSRPSPTRSESPDARRPDLSRARDCAAHRGVQREDLAQPRSSLPVARGERGSHGTATELRGRDRRHGAAGSSPNWSVGLRFSVPLGNNSARADVAAAG